MIKHFYTEFKNGHAIIPTRFEFHPHHFEGTDEEYESKLTEIFGKFWDNDYGKVIGTHEFDTYEEWCAKFGKPIK